MVRTRAGMIAALASLALVAGCGSDSDDTDDGDAGGTAAEKPTREFASGNSADRQLCEDAGGDFDRTVAGLAVCLMAHRSDCEETQAERKGQECWWRKSRYLEERFATKECQIYAQANKVQALVFDLENAEYGCFVRFTG